MGLLGVCGRGDGVGVGRVARYDIGFELRLERSLLQCSGGGPAEDIGPQFEIVGTVAIAFEFSIDCTITDRPALDLLAIDAQREDFFEIEFQQIRRRFLRLHRSRKPTQTQAEN